MTAVAADSVSIILMSFSIFRFQRQNGYLQKRNRHTGCLGKDKGSDDPTYFRLTRWGRELCRLAAALDPFGSFWPYWP